MIDHLLWEICNYFLGWRASSSAAPSSLLGFEYALWLACRLKGNSKCTCSHFIGSEDWRGGGAGEGGGGGGGGGLGVRARILALIYRHHWLGLDCICNAAGKLSQEL